MQINLYRAAPRGREAESKLELIAWRGTLERVREAGGAWPAPGRVHGAAGFCKAATGSQMAQLVRVLAAKLKDMSLIPGIHGRRTEPIPTQEPCSHSGERGCGSFPLWLDVPPSSSSACLSAMAQLDE